MLCQQTSDNEHQPPENQWPLEGALEQRPRNPKKNHGYISKEIMKTTALNSSCTVASYVKAASNHLDMDGARQPIISTRIENTDCV